MISKGRQNYKETIHFVAIPVKINMKNVDHLMTLFEDSLSSGSGIFRTRNTNIMLS